jgi:hypothetical protein
MPHRDRTAGPAAGATVPAAALLMFVVVALTGAGCGAPAAVLYKLMGPPPIPPKYVVPQVPLLLLVENAHSGSVAIPEADELARVIYDDLQEHHVAPLIDFARLHELRDHDPKAFGRMTIAQIGHELGARQVLYLHVDQINIEQPQGGDVVRLKIAVQAKMVDVPTATTVWPTGGDTEPYDHETRLQRIEPGTTRAGLNHQILRQSGLDIARWFYQWQPDTMTEENQGERLR